MKPLRLREIEKNSPEKKVDSFQSKELSKYHEKLQYKDVSRNKQMERKFSEKHFKSIKDNNSVRDKKSEIIEGMVKKDFPLSSEKQKNNIEDFHFVDKNEFQKELKKRDPSGTEKDIRLTKGFHDSRDNQAFVKDQRDTLVTGIHEKLHQKSQSELPTRLNEGITEHYAREKAGGIGELINIDKHGREIPKTKSDYEREVEIVKKIEAIIGKEPLNKAYFDGRADILEKHFESAMGEGSFQKLTNALENRDYKTASDIIDNS